VIPEIKTEGSSRIGFVSSEKLDLKQGIEFCVKLNLSENKRR
jgi:hypothetical protein